MKYFNYKIFKGYIRPKNAIDLPKMIAGLKIIQKLYLSVDCEC